MTTRVTVDAHAGWPVKVILLNGEPDSDQSALVEIVEANTTRDIYIHSGQSILSITEMKSADSE